MKSQVAFKAEFMKKLIKSQIGLIGEIQKTVQKIFLLNFKGVIQLEILGLNCEGEPKGRQAKFQSENFSCQCVKYVLFILYYLFMKNFI